jgi:hypothetical protein
LQFSQLTFHLSTVALTGDSLSGIRPQAGKKVSMSPPAQRGARLAK